MKPQAWLTTTSSSDAIQLRYTMGADIQGASLKRSYKGNSQRDGHHLHGGPADAGGRWHQRSARPSRECARREEGALGIDALRQYREKVDEKRGIALGPLHDWTSHAADAFRYFCVGHQEEVTQKPMQIKRKWVV